MHLVGKQIFFFFFSLLRGPIVWAWQQLLAGKLLQFEVTSEDRHCKAKFSFFWCFIIIFFLIQNNVFGGMKLLDFVTVSWRVTLHGAKNNWMPSCRVAHIAIIISSTSERTIISAARESMCTVNTAPKELGGGQRWLQGDDKEQAVSLRRGSCL